MADFSRQVAGRQARLDHLRPADDQRDGDPALMAIALVEPERRVAHVRPGHAVALVGLFASGQRLRIVADGDGQPLGGFLRDMDPLPISQNLFGAGAVVGEEHHQRILLPPDLLDLLQDCADRPVHRIDLGGIGFHPPLVPGAQRRLRPGKHPRIARRELPVTVNDADVDHPLVALLAEFVPAHIEAARVGIEDVLSGVQRPMRGREGYIQKKRRGDFLRTVEHRGGLLADRLGVIEIRILYLADKLVLPHQGHRVEVTPRADKRAVEVIEAALPRPRVFRTLPADVPSQVPLADHGRLVAGCAEQLGDRGALGVQIAAVARQPEVDCRVPDASLVGVEAGQQRRAGRAAAPGAVELGEPEPLGGQAVQIRGHDHLGPVAAEVREPEVVGRDQQDIGPLLGDHAGSRLGRSLPGKAQNRQANDQSPHGERLPVPHAFQPGGRTPQRRRLHPAGSGGKPRTVTHGMPPRSLY